MRTLLALLLLTTALPAWAGKIPFYVYGAACPAGSRTVFNGTAVLWTVNPTSALQSAGGECWAVLPASAGNAADPNSVSAGKFPYYWVIGDCALCR